METEGSLPRSQEPATGPIPELVEFSPHLLFRSLKQSIKFRGLFIS